MDWAVLEPRASGRALGHRTGGVRRARWRGRDPAAAPDGIDLEIGWQLARPFWGRGLATEAGHGAAHYAFTAGVDEVFAVVRPHNTRGIATARRVGMEWVGETDKYYELTLQVYRLREGDLDVPPLLEHHSRTGSE
ncbi:GNAT family N-acetyltransferase [Streptomyces chiangmaiensis]